ncbi:hypothetical protein Q8A73_015875 [Channa argus]|nr:hypothetical protein Q8A73_015875 [Channa argus]
MQLEALRVLAKSVRVSLSFRFAASHSCSHKPWGATLVSEVGFHRLVDMRAEEVLGAGSAPGRFPSWHRPVRAATWEAAGDSLEGEGTSQAQPAPRAPTPELNHYRETDLIESMVANDIIEPSDSPWAAPMVMVRKKTGKWRPCVDYRGLNAITRKDSFPLPRIDDALDYVAGSCWFSSLDLRSGYWQVELAPEARPKTAFTIGQGLWQFKVMPFGLCNAPATFERLMEQVLKDIPRSRCVVYLDDLLVHAKGFEDAISNLAGVFTAIRQAGLWLNPAKCYLLARETQFLGQPPAAVRCGYVRCGYVRCGKEWRLSSSQAAAAKVG